MYRPVGVQPSPCVYRVGVPICRFRSSITRPTDASVYASACSSRSPAARLEVRWFRYSFPAGLFHSLLHAGLSRRSHTTASRAVKRLKKSPPPGPQLRGPSEVFRIVKVIRGISASQLSAGIDSCCTVTPFPESPVGSNTETDDDCRRRQFSIGKLSVRKLPSQSNNSRRVCRFQRTKGEKCAESP